MAGHCRRRRIIVNTVKGGSVLKTLEKASDSFVPLSRASWMSWEDEGGGEEG